ncbi:MAG: hypothetical protein H6698_00220 [Myxococcales bacterium]|nr:hypothetical protein [Myxococcales bacterium]MCB9531613.1 hypothetical protein [Myxococcales bacterium]MCB9532736.1 hypothetical protein [Myxococcales bacterium]
MGRPAHPSSLRSELLVAAAPALALLVAYRHSPAFELIGDADALIRQNEYVRSWSFLGQTLTADYFWSSTLGPIGYWRPLTKVSWLIEYLVGAGNPAVFQVVQVAWLCLLVTGVAALSRALGLSRAGSAIAGTAVALAPALVEPGCLVMARSDVTAMAGACWGMVGFLRWRDGGAARWLVLHTVALAVALASKESAVLVAPLLAAWALRASGGSRAEPSDVATALAPAFVICAAYLALRHVVLPPGETQFVFDPLRVLVSVAAYLRGVAPLNLESTIRNISHSEAQSAASLVTACVTILAYAAAAIALAARRGAHVVSLWLWGAFSLVLVVTVADMNVPGVAGKYPLSDRWGGFALIAVSIGAVALVETASERVRRFAGVVFGVWAVAALAVSGELHSVYASQQALLALEDEDFEATPPAFRTAVDTCRHLERAIGHALASEDLNEGLAAVDAIAASGCPSNVDLEINTLQVLVRARAWERALPVARSLAARPGLARGRFVGESLIGTVLLRTGRPAEALPRLQFAADNAPQLCENWRNLAEARAALGELGAAAEALESAYSCGRAAGVEQPAALQLAQELRRRAAEHATAPSEGSATGADEGSSDGAAVDGPR